MLPPSERQEGLTLLELLVSIVLLASIGMIASLFLSQSLKSTNKLESYNEALMQLQTGLSILQRDIENIKMRSYINDTKQFVPALLFREEESGETSIQFIRHGEHSRQKAPVLIRVNFQDRRLLRETSSVVDGVAKNDWQSMVLMGDIESMDFKFFLANTWQEELRLQQSTYNRQEYPKAIKVSVRHSYFGLIEKIIRLPAYE